MNKKRVMMQVDIIFREAIKKKYPDFSYRLATKKLGEFLNEELYGKKKG